MLFVVPIAASIYGLTLEESDLVAESPEEVRSGPQSTNAPAWSWTNDETGKVTKIPRPWVRDNENQGESVLLLSTEDGSGAISLNRDFFDYEVRLEDYAKAWHEIELDNLGLQTNFEATEISEHQMLASTGRIEESDGALGVEVYLWTFDSKIFWQAILVTAIGEAGIRNDGKQLLPRLVETTTL